MIDKPIDSRAKHLLHSLRLDLLGEWRNAESVFPLDDLSAAYNKIDMFDTALSRAEGRHMDIYPELLKSRYAKFYESLEDGFHGLREAFDAAEHDITQMVDNGWADEGYEEMVQEEIENTILPALEEAMATFVQEYGTPIASDPDPLDEAVLAAEPDPDPEPEPEPITADFIRIWKKACGMNMNLGTINGASIQAILPIQKHRRDEDTHVVIIVCHPHKLDSKFGEGAYTVASIYRFQGLGAHTSWDDGDYGHQTLESAMKAALRRANLEVVA